MKGINLLNTLYKFRKLIAAFVILIGFFVYYNMFRIDLTLENLRFSLEQTALAYDVVDINGFDMILAQAAIKEITPVSMNAFDLGNLEYVTSIVKSGVHFQQLDSMKTGLDVIIKEKEKRRGAILTILDKINKPVRQGMEYLAHLPYIIFRPKPPAVQKVNEVTAIALIEKIRDVEKEADLRNTILEYNKLIEEYTGTDKLPLLELRLAYVYHRLGEYNKALKLYKEIVRMYYPSQEAKIAKVLFDSLKKKNRLLKEANSLVIKADGLPEDEIEAKQKIFHRLGIIYTQLFNLEQASKFFKRIVAISPKSDIAIKVQFNLAWVLKQQCKFEESLNEFSKVIEKEPSRDLILNSRYQMADILHSQGKFLEAIKIYEEITKEYEGKAIAALCIFQQANIYKYDLHDPEKAQELYDKLIEEYKDTPYAKFLAPEQEPIRVFVTYVVPRATRVLTWRVAGLFCVSGYFGELGKGSILTEEDRLNVALNSWCAEEFPDTLGNIYFDVKGVEINLEKNRILASGRVTFGKFSMRVEIELYINPVGEGGIDMKVTKVFLNEIPVPPVFMNNTISGILYLLNKYFPLMITEILMEKGSISAQGFAGERMLSRIKIATKRRLAGETKIEDLEDPEERRQTYNIFEEKFPESNFTPAPSYVIDELFLDFFTRMCLFAGYKLLETVKDTRFDYYRSVRTLGRLELKEDRFRVSFADEHINASISEFIKLEFPWLINESFLFDIIGVEVHFQENGEIGFDGYFGLGHKEELELEAKGVHIEGTMVIEIDKESKIPRPVFKKVNVNDEPFPVEKLNLVTLRLLALLKDAGMPLKLEKAEITEGTIVLKGKAPEDYLNRLFGGRYLFDIFHIREQDLGLAGIERLKEPLPLGYLDYRSGVQR